MRTNISGWLMYDCETMRTRMVDCQIRPAEVTDLAIIAAMGEIPREQFLSESQAPLAYIDADLPIDAPGGGTPRYMMEPASFARLLQLAEIRSDAIVLDVGCATGYSAAVLAQLCSSVVALEEDRSLANQATNNLADLEIDNAVVVTGPLAKGFAKEGPFDAIFIGGAVDAVPDELVGQLKDGGKLVTVVGHGGTGSATRYVREGGKSAKREFFNCAVWPMPGFEKHAEFNF